MARPHSLLAYNAAGLVKATLDYAVARDDAGNVIGLVDFAEHEASGGQHTDIWTVSTATGSKVWPEWLGTAAHDFHVELAGPPGRKHIAALVHQTSGHRRERAAIEQAIEEVEPDAQGAKDIRHIVGGPTRHIPLDANGRNAPVVSQATPSHLPIHRARA